MGTIRNVLLIMCDQLRADYLSCMGHPTLQTTHIDALAARGLTFTRAYCSAPTCGPSRMSVYTGRSMFSHGSVWNFVPLSLRELTLGDYLRPAGLSATLVGKTHYGADRDGMARLGISPDSPVGERLVAGSFESLFHYEGHANPGSAHDYVQYLKERGYTATDDPWENEVMSARDIDGALVSGWSMRNMHLPSEVREEDSETAYTTNRAIEYIRAQGDQPWCMHLSYIKPHWPYIAPAPYHNMYGPDDCVPIVKHQRERDDPHPVMGAYFQHGESVVFARDEVALHVRPAYMGLVKQIDDHVGRLMAELAGLGRLDDTLILFTSDHGDYLGDHWLGDKDLFHDASSRIPFIVYDPSPSADATRGAQTEALVEAIDFLPTLLDGLAIPQPAHLLEGRSVLPLTRSTEDRPWREFAVSEIDYAFREARVILGRDPRECRGFMIRDARWKYIWWDGFRCQLFDMESDPDELLDLHASPAEEPIRVLMKERLFAWMRARKLSVTLPDKAIVVSRHTIEPKHGIKIGVW